MIYPSTYNEMFAWVGIKKLRSFFELTNEQAEELYESLRTKQSRLIMGYPNGTIIIQALIWFIPRLIWQPRLPPAPPPEDPAATITTTIITTITTDGRERKNHDQR